MDFEDLHGPSLDDVTQQQHTQSRNSDQNLKKILGPKNYFLDESIIREENEHEIENENDSVDVYNDSNSFHFDDSDEETQRVLEEGIVEEIEERNERGEVAYSESNSKKITLNSSGNKTFGLSLLLNLNKS